MTSLPPSLAHSRSEFLARSAQGLGFCLILLFLLTILGSFLPPQLLDPNWQLTLASNLIDNGAYPLLGFFLVVLASYIDPGNQAIERRQAQLRALACWVAIAYLLLAPLQGIVFLRGFSQAGSGLRQQTQRSHEAIVNLRAAISTSGSFSELQARLRQLQAPSLPPDASSLPLRQLKTNLIDQLEASDNALKQNLRQPLVGKLWPTLQKTLRNMLAALVLGLGFASIGTPKGSSLTLLQSWSTRFRGLGTLSRQIKGRWQNWSQERKEHRQMALRLAQIRLAHKQGDQSPGRGGKSRRSTKNNEVKAYFEQINAAGSKNDDPQL